MEMKDNKSDELNAVMTSLYYLEAETNKAGMKEVSGILKKTINDIEGWINTGSCCGSDLQEIIIGFYTIYWNCFIDHLRMASAICPTVLRSIESYTTERTMTG
jgi:hypothetical protein